MCVFENTGQGVTRTQGFWATHTPLANIAWFGGTAFGHTFPGVAAVSGIGDTMLCGRNLGALDEVMGAFIGTRPGAPSVSGASRQAWTSALAILTLGHRLAALGVRGRAPSIRSRCRHRHHRSADRLRGHQDHPLSTVSLLGSASRRPACAQAQDLARTRVVTP
jgi:hypothetical protein